jgi:hypothetical protein
VFIAHFGLYAPLATLKCKHESSLRKLSGKNGLIFQGWDGTRY